MCSPCLNALPIFVFSPIRSFSILYRLFETQVYLFFRI